jgi:hypothetical protein
VNDSVDSIQRFAQLICVEQISFNKTRARDNRITMTFREVVIDHHLVAVIN